MPWYSIVYCEKFLLVQGHVYNLLTGVSLFAYEIMLPLHRQLLGKRSKMEHSVHAS